MSREELGDVADEGATRTTLLAAPALAAPALAAPRPPARSSSPGTTPTLEPDPPGTPARIRRRHAVAAGLTAVLLAICGASGWIAARLWTDTPSSPVGDEPAAWAVVVDARLRGETGARLLVDVTVRLTNLGRAPMILTGAETTFDAGSVEAVVPDSVPVRPGEAVEVVARSAIACRSPLPLRLFPLQVRRADHTLVTVPISGATAALTAVCGAQDLDSAVLALTRVAPDGNRLALVLRSPTGRTTGVVGAHAGGVQLTGRPFGAFDGNDRILWLDPPRTCPAPWLAGGLPRIVTLEIDAGGPATVDLDTGFALARWLRAGPCAGSRR